MSIGSTLPTLNSPARLAQGVILALLLYTQFVAVSDFMVFMPLGPELAKAMAFPVSQAAWFSGSYAAAAALSGLLLAGWLDRWPRMPVLLGLLLAKAAVMATTGWVTQLTTLTLVRGVAGLLSAPIAALGMAMAVDLFSGAQRARALALVSLSFPLAAIIGVPVGLLVARHWGWHWATWLNAAAMLLALLGWLGCSRGLSLWRRPSATVVAGGRFSLSAVWQHPEMLWGAGLTGLGVFGAFLFIPHLAAIVQYNMHYPRAVLEQLYLYGGLCTIVATQLTARILPNRRIERLLLWVCIATALLLLSLFVVQLALPVLLFFMAFMSLNACRNLLIQTQVSEVPQPHQRAGYFALLGTVRHLASGAAAVVSALVLSAAPDGRLSHLDWLALVAITALGLMPFCSLALRRRLSPAPASS